MNSIEKMVADVLDENKIEYDFQYFLNRKGVCKSYDFKIRNKNIFIEVDGDYWHGGPGVKKYFKNVDKIKKNDILKDELANKNGFKVIRFWESQIKKNANVVIKSFKQNK